MKLIRSQYLVLTLEKAKSEWKFVVPSGLLQTGSERERLKIYVKKCVYRNDFPVITDNRNQVLYNGNLISVKKGSPNSLMLAEELSSKTGPNLMWTFDAYNGTFIISNAGTTTATIKPVGAFAQVLGMTPDLEVSIPAGTEYNCPYGVDLAPPETIIFRLRGLSSSSVEVHSDLTTRSADLLVAIGSDVVPYQTKVYRDNEGLYGHFLNSNKINDLELRLEDAEGNQIYSANQMTMIIAIEVYSDDQSEMLSVMKEQLENMKLSLLQNDLASAVREAQA